MQLIIGFLFLLTFFYLLKNLLQGTKVNQKFLLKIALFLAGGILILLVLTGRIHILAALGAGLVMLLRNLPGVLRALPLLKHLYGKAYQSATPGQQSTLDTSLLMMTLDHATGTMDGEILAGKFTGQWLSGLSVPQLAEVYLLAQANHADSVEVLETFFERTLGEDWLAQLGVAKADGPKDNSAGLSVDDACDVLGVSASATEEEIIEAHRRLMQRFHPDRGGSNYLAAKVNEAKTVLLEALKRR